MYSQFASLLKGLVLPFGAITGTRIVLDGVNGKILVYDVSDQEVISIAASTQQIVVANPSDSSFVAMRLGKPIGSGTGSSVAFQPPAVSGTTWDQGYINGNKDSSTPPIPYLTVTAPTNTGQSTSQLLLFGRSTGGSTTGFSLRGQDSNIQADTLLVEPSIGSNVKVTFLVAATAAAAVLFGTTTSTTSGNRFIGTRNVNDSLDSFTVDFDGKLQWGDGTTLDTSLTRASAGVLNTPGDFTIRSLSPHLRVATTTETTNSSNLTAETTVQSITFNATSGKTYRIHAHGRAQSDTAGDRIRFAMRQDSNTGTRMDLGNIYQDATGDALSFESDCEWTASSTASKTFVLTLARYTGTGNVFRVAGSDYPVRMTVDLIS